MRRQISAIDTLEGVESATITFCKNASLNQTTAMEKREYELKIVGQS
jgi:hypothetical protein